MNVAENYLAVWNEPDAAAREKRLREVFADGAKLTDPRAEVAGHAELAALISGVREQFPGMEFRLAGPVDQHHGIARFTWHAGPGDDPVVGFDVVKLAPDGRISEVLGFLDRVPQG
ncbi:nuclear transport factor 2 family protein [Actinoplanes sp. RD1]|uniref:nuclear transport factor 2 family protein n=1 Tax=Actinoplanes sp. RD1 TaxID=3064538 RepID=UPI0027420A0E|nr:nuclear transport factor 2 family protein [Actinoplanes sp. RD1]